jgi:hypothetical protein
MTMSQANDNLTNLYDVKIVLHVVNIVWLWYPILEQSLDSRFFLSEIQYIKHLLLIDIEYDNSNLKLAHTKSIQTGLGPLTNDYQVILDILIDHDIPYTFSQDPHDFFNIQVCTWAIKFYSTISHLSMLTIPSQDLGSMYKITQSLPDHYACLIQASPDLHDDIYQLYHPNPASSLS